MSNYPNFPSSNEIGTGSGGNPFSQQCNTGYVTSFGGDGGDFMDQFGITGCSTGTYTPDPPNSSNGSNGSFWGGSGENPPSPQQSVSCPAGFTTIGVSAGAYVNYLQLYCGTSITHMGGSVTASGGGTVNQTYSCPAGQVIIGIKGQSGRWIDNLNFTCDFPPNCLEPSSVFDTTCSAWATANETQYLANVATYCEPLLSDSSSSAERTNCTQVIIANPGKFDTMMTTYCATTAGKADPLCSCIDPTSPEVDSSFQTNASSTALANLNSALEQMEARPDCFDQTCVTGGYLTQSLVNVHGVTCPSINSVACINYSQLSLSGGSSVAGSVALSQSPDCQSSSSTTTNVSNGSSSSTGSTGSSSPTSPTNSSNTSATGNTGTSATSNTPTSGANSSTSPTNSSTSTSSTSSTNYTTLIIIIAVILLVCAGLIYGIRKWTRRKKAPNNTGQVQGTKRPVPTVGLVRQ